MGLFTEKSLQIMVDLFVAAVKYLERNMALKGLQSLPIILRLTVKLKDHTGTLGRCCGKHVDQRKAPIENGANTSFTFFGPTASQSEKDLGVHPFS